MVLLQHHHHHNPRSSLFHVKATTQFLKLAQAYESSPILNPFLRLDPPNLELSISLPTQRFLISSHSSPKSSILDFVLKEAHDVGVVATEAAQEAADGRP